MVMSMLDRFLEKVARIDDSDSCWLWLGYTDKDGYGTFRGPNDKVQAHRFSFQLAYGPIPRGYMVCHTCDNPTCVRPDHLFLGTASDNTRDAMAKGRMAVGTANPRATITEDDVRLIRKLYAEAPLSPDGKRKRDGVLKRIVELTGKSKWLIQDVVTGRSWAHVAVDSAVERTAQ